MSLSGASEPDQGAGSDPRRPIEPETPEALSRGPEIRELTREECEALLRRNTVGRIAFAFQRRVDILPVHYVYEDGWLYGRTSPGIKTDMWRHSRWVAFEVDEVRALFDWSSVIVHGGLYPLRPEGVEADNWQQAVELLKRLVPGTGTAYDPVPQRTIVFRIHVDGMYGRMALPPVDER